jgi:putative NADPH-quinone reductase
MRLLFVHANPVPESFGAALCRAAVEAAREAGHDVRLIDLHEVGFDPVMGAEERRGYTGEGPVPADLVPHVGALQWAEGVILVYPTWWYAQPAILKGWMDRVWRPGHRLHAAHAQRAVARGAEKCRAGPRRRPHPARRVSDADRTCRRPARGGRALCSGRGAGSRRTGR